MRHSIDTIFETRNDTDIESKSRGVPLITFLDLFNDSESLPVPSIMNRRRSSTCKGKQLAQSGSTVLISTPVSRSHRTPVLTLNPTPTITLKDIYATPSHQFIPSNRTDTQRPADTSIPDTTAGILEVPSNGTNPSVFSTRMEHSCTTDVVSNTTNCHTHNKFMKNGPPRDIPQSPPDPTIPVLNCEEVYDVIDHQGCTHA